METYRMDTFRWGAEVSTAVHSVDTTSLSGLRGLLMLHVVLSNTMRHMHPSVDLCGTLQMPLFFFLSGFTLGLKEGNIVYRSAPYLADGSAQRPEIAPHYNQHHFWWRRFARLIPMYWIAVIACIYLVTARVDNNWDNNGGVLDLSLGNVLCYLMLLTCTTTWFVPVYGFVGIGGYNYINPVVWFVSSIAFCYWCFPTVLPELQRLSRSQKQSFIWWFWVFQASLLWGLWAFLSLMKSQGNDNKQDVLMSATMWPPTRFPIFLMGVLTGLLRCSTPAHKHPDNVRVWGMHHLIPPPEHGDDPQWWARFVNLEFLLVLLGIVVPLLLMKVFAYGIAYVNLLLILPIFYVPFVYGLTCDEGLSLVSQTLQSSPLQFLGSISYQLYLWHEPVNLYFMLIVAQIHPKSVLVIDYTKDTIGGPGRDNGQEVTAIDDRDSDTIRNLYTLPPWSVPLVMAFAIVFSYMVHVTVAEPIRSCINDRNPFRRNSDTNGTESAESSAKLISHAAPASTFGSVDTTSMDGQQDQDDIAPSVQSHRLDNSEL